MADAFVYVTYIRATPEKVWEALTRPEFTRLYWNGVSAESDWTRGSTWRLVFADGTLGDAGEVLEIDPPRRLVLSWRNEFMPELTAEGYSTASFEIEPREHAVKLTVTHQIDQDSSKLIKAVSGGWPGILSNLKTLLETGEPYDVSVYRPRAA
jgi:uncharacterized protein YndB with AHSA1/START domain